MAKGRIVAAAGTAAGTTNLTDEGRARAARIEKAMSEAVTACYKRGISDPAEILKAKLAAREKAQ